MGGVVGKEGQWWGEWWAKRDNGGGKWGAKRDNGGGKWWAKRDNGGGKWGAKRDNGGGKWGAKSDNGGGGGQWKCLGFSLKGGRDAVNLVVHRWKEFVGGRMQSNS